MDKPKRPRYRNGDCIENKTYVRTIRGLDENYPPRTLRGIVVLERIIMVGNTARQIVVIRKEDGKVDIADSDFFEKI